MENRNSKFCLSLLLYLSLLARQSNAESLEAIRLFLRVDNDEKRKKQICTSSSVSVKPMQVVPSQHNYSESIRVHVLVNELYPNFHGEALGATSLLFYDSPYPICMDTYDDLLKTKSFAQGFNVADDELDLILAANDIELPQLFVRDQNSPLSDCGNLDHSSLEQQSVTDVNMIDETSDNIHNATQSGALNDVTSPCDVPFSSLSLEDLPASVDSGVHDEVDTLDGRHNDSDFEDKSVDVTEFPSLPGSNVEQGQDDVELFDPNESFLTGADVDELLATIDDDDQVGNLNEADLFRQNSNGIENEQTSDYDTKDGNFKTDNFEGDSNSSELSQNEFLLASYRNSAVTKTYFPTRGRLRMSNSHSSRYTSFNSDSAGSSSVDFGEYDEASRSSTHSVSSDYSTQFGTSSAPFNPLQFHPLQFNGAGAMSVDMDSDIQHQHRDVQLLLEANVPFSYEEVAYSSNEEFRRMRSTHELTDEQCSAMLDARRRATNRKAAERCRQQKNIERNGLSDDLKSLLDKKQEMEKQVAKARHRRDRARDNLTGQRQELFSRLRDSSNRPLHPNQWKLQLTEEGQLMLIRREMVTES